MVIETSASREEVGGFGLGRSPAGSRVRRRGRALPKTLACPGDRKWKVNSAPKQLTLPAFSNIHKQST